MSNRYDTSVKVQNTYLITYEAGSIMTKRIVAADRSDAIRSLRALNIRRIVILSVIKIG
jgi:hypothetical protein